ncbi:flagellar biosynthesis protein FlaG [Pseudomonas sp. FFUP_PS_473]|uniref:flagellar protein FlaG n=1 Tax=Pseudomonas TaxID=286 RepID=UPI000C7AEF13|nr:MULTISPECIES: flagellar protein FlaG [Pseudomonas]MBM3109055.1 flagellar protein FlaG [Pseudomonas arcuscaelestis]PLP93197.1 flagellar biosynthesis protein FlaG [Pseudomonas sp. FFUP_PS_473]
MDMSVKLNASYPLVRPTEQAADKPAPQAVQAVQASSEAPTASSRDNRDSRDDVSETEKVKSAVKEIEKFLASSRRNLEFSTDEESGRIVVKVIASETGELVRQLPSEEALRIAHSLSDMSSLLFDAKV